MGKKNKKTEQFDMSPEEQMLVANELNALIDGKVTEIPSIGNESIDVSNPIAELFNEIDARLAEEDEKNNEFSDSNSNYCETVEENSHANDMNDESKHYDTEWYEVAKESSSTISSGEIAKNTIKAEDTSTYGISIHIDRADDIFSISRGYIGLIANIDASNIPSYQDPKETPDDITTIYCTLILKNFQPSVIMKESEFVNSIMSKVSSLDECKFFFYSYRGWIFGYLINRDDYERYCELFDIGDENENLVAIYNSLLEMVSNPLFSWKYRILHDKSEIKESSDREKRLFVTELMNDKYTKLTDSNNMLKSVTVIPFIQNEDDLIVHSDSDEDMIDTSNLSPEIAEQNTGVVDIFSEDDDEEEDATEDEDSNDCSDGKNDNVNNDQCSCDSPALSTAFIATKYASSQINEGATKLLAKYTELMNSPDSNYENANGKIVSDEIEESDPNDDDFIIKPIV